MRLSCSQKRLLTRNNNVVLVLEVLVAACYLVTCYLVTLHQHAPGKAQRSQSRPHDDILPAHHALQCLALQLQPPFDFGGLRQRPNLLVGAGHFAGNERQAKAWGALPRTKYHTINALHAQ